jgi:hypothetical protein
MTRNKLPKLTPKRLTGEEAFRTDGEGSGFQVLDFWSWSSSNLAANNLRGHVAEFIVAQALGIASDAREEWDAYDLMTKSGVRIEVKSSAYIQTWAQNELSNISFTISEAKAWDSDTGKWSETTQRNSDVYVFCLIETTDQEKFDVLDLGQWSFYVVLTSTLNEVLGPQKSISLSNLKSLQHSKANFRELNGAVCSVLGVSEL